MLEAGDQVSAVVASLQKTANPNHADARWAAPSLEADAIRSFVGVCERPIAPEQGEWLLAAVCLTCSCFGGAQEGHPLSAILATRA